MLNTRKSKVPAPVGGGVVRKSKSANTVIHKDQNAVGKRQGDVLQDPTQKRAAFGDITNAHADPQKSKVTLKKSKIPAQRPLPKLSQPSKPSTKENKLATKKDKKTSRVLPAPKASTSNSSLGIDADAIALLCSQDSSSSSDSCESSQELLSSQGSVEDLLVPVDDHLDEHVVPQDVEDVDKENLQDPVQVSLYAWDIFQYYKDRELEFRVDNYMPRQGCITTSMRAILVDWLVEVQENFELNHETLYLAVKLVDMYLARVKISKEALQLIGAVSLFIAAKFDERLPPLVEDFLYICDDAYKRREFLAMERTILIEIGFDIGMPLSYRFLRRYAKCGKANMETLTQARYILEMSLMEYSFMTRRESEMAAAALWLALRMKHEGEWTKTLEHYTGFTSSQLAPLGKKLNSYISAPHKQLSTIKSKYSHRVFYEVAKTPTLEENDFVGLL